MPHFLAFHPEAVTLQTENLHRKPITPKTPEPVNACTVAYMQWTCFVRPLNSVDQHLPRLERRWKRIQVPADSPPLRGTCS